MRSLSPCLGKRLLLGGSLILLAGCQTVTTKQNLSDFNQEFGSGQYEAAAESALHFGGIKADGSGGDLLWSLQAGSALSASGQFELSTRVFDSAEEMIQQEDTEHILRTGAEKAIAILGNNGFNRYDPNVYDGVMVNTYKALNNIFIKDFQNARIEFNRAADRQRRAEEEFRSRIEEQKEKLAQTREQTEGDNAQSSQLDYAKSRKASEQTVYDAYPELKEWQAYPDFVNPYTDYLHGLYFMLASQDKEDFGKAVSPCAGSRAWRRTTAP